VWTRINIRLGAAIGIGWKLFISSASLNTRGRGDVISIGPCGKKCP
jgi:hypothetical protein